MTLGAVCDHRFMSDEGDSPSSFEDALRVIAQEISRAVERFSEEIDLDAIAQRLREQAETMASAPWSAPAPPPTAGRATRMRGAEPHPLDLPTDEQGLALAALDSGRWGLEPGTSALTSRADGPGPSDALGLVRELRARDWLDADGELTLAGRHALGRWLDAAQQTRP